ncbi:MULTISPECIES: hypothetical protein [Nocardia]
MAYAESDYVDPIKLCAVDALEILIAGGFGVGKTTLVTTVSAR